jgi:multicomponent Na+:H+ antiporter subunit E
MRPARTSGSGGFPASRAGAGLVRAAALAVLWWALTGGEAASWLFGVPIVLIAAASSVALSPPAGWRVSPAGFAAFVPYFVWRSLCGGADVAVRAVQPGLPIAPSLEVFPLRLAPDGPARVFFANTVSLMPGTLSAELHEDAILVHVLSGGPQTLQRLRELEGRVAALFGERLPDDRPAGHD